MIFLKKRKIKTVAVFSVLFLVMAFCLAMFTYILHIVNGETLATNVSNIEGLTYDFDSTKSPSEFGIIYTNEMVPYSTDPTNVNVVFQFKLDSCTSSSDQVGFIWGDSYSNNSFYDSTRTGGKLFNNGSTEILKEDNVGKYITMVWFKEYGCRGYVTDNIPTLTANPSNGILEVVGASDFTAFANVDGMENGSQFNIYYSNLIGTTKGAKRYGLILGGGQASISELKVFDESGNNLGVNVTGDFTEPKPSFEELVSEIEGETYYFNSDLSYYEQTMFYTDVMTPWSQSNVGEFVVFSFKLESTNSANGRFGVMYGQEYGNNTLYDKSRQGGFLFEDGTDKLINSNNVGKYVTLIMKRSTLGTWGSVTDDVPTIYFDGTLKVNGSDFTAFASAIGNNASGEEYNIWSFDYAGLTNAKVYGLSLGAGVGKISEVKIFDENGNNLGVNVTGDFTEYAITTTPSEKGSVSLSQSNNEITVSIVPDSFCALSSLTINNVNKTSEVINNAYTFTLTEDVTISTTFSVIGTSLSGKSFDILESFGNENTLLHTDVLQSYNDSSSSRFIIFQYKLDSASDSTDRINFEWGKTLSSTGRLYSNTSIGGEAYIDYNENSTRFLGSSCEGKYITAIFDRAGGYYCSAYVTDEVPSFDLDGTLLIVKDATAFIWAPHELNNPKDGHVFGYDENGDFNVSSWARGGETTKSAKIFGISLGNGPASISEVKIFDENGKDLGVNLITHTASFVGTQLRVSEPTGLGFISRINKKYYDNLTDNYSTVVTGTIILPTDYMEKWNINSLSFESLTGKTAGVDYLNVVNKGFLNAKTAEQDNYYEFRGSIVNIRKYNYDRAFSAIGYVGFGSGEDNLQYIYTDYINKFVPSSVESIAMSALTDIKETEDDEYFYSVDFATNENGLSYYTCYDQNIISVLAKYASNLGFVLVDNSVSTAEKNAREAFVNYYKEATGKDIMLVSSNYSGLANLSNVISIGNTALFKNANIDLSGISDDGYVIKVVNGQIFINGLIERGTVYGVQGFFENFFDATFVDKDNYEITKNSNFNICNVTDVIFTPTFAMRQYATGDNFQQLSVPATSAMQHVNGLYTYVEQGSYLDQYGGSNEIAFYGNIQHNMGDYVKAGVDIYNAANGTSLDYRDYCKAASFYNDGNYDYMPCMSSGVTKDTGTNANNVHFTYLALKALITEKYASGVKTYSLGILDCGTEDWYNTKCNCSYCQSKFNNDDATGLLIAFLNAVCYKLDNDPEIAANYSDYSIVTMAYSYCIEPQAGDPNLDDNVVVQIVRRHEDATKCISDDSFIYSVYTKWREHTNRTSFQVFNMDSSYFVQYYQGLNSSIVKNVKWLKDQGVEIVYVLGKYTDGDFWEDRIASYIYTKLMWNFDNSLYNSLGADGYFDALLNEYLTVYYKNSATGVRDFYDYYSNLFKTKVPAGDYFNSAKNLSLSEHLAALDMVEELITNESDNSVKLKLKAIKAEIVGAIVANYKIYYPSNNVTQATTYYDDFKGLCDEVGIDYWSEGQTITGYRDSFLAQWA